MNKWYSDIQRDYEGLVALQGGVFGLMGMGHASTMKGQLEGTPSKKLMPIDSVFSGVTNPNAGHSGQPS